MRPAILLAIAALLAAAEPRLDPPFQRLDLEPTATREIAFALRAEPGTVATAVVVDCACLHALSATPATVGADGVLALRFRASGIRPGVEEILVATSAGIARAQLQIAGPGTGDGLTVLRSALASADRQHLMLWGIVHDLHGQVRNCGCSQGSLGGIGHLAALPAQAAALAPGVATRWLLTGDGDGRRPGVAAALAERGWRRDDPAVAVSADPLPLLAAPGLVAVIPTTAIAVNHRRLLRPVLADGLVVELLLVDAAGAIQDHRVLPVDATLADDAAVVARFPDRLSAVIDATAQPGAACLACHAGAHAAWAASGHARALERLPAADRTDACIGCHTTPLRDGVLAGGVSCQSCHPGGEAHAASAGRTPTGATADCRSCHSPQHHPGFQREAAWAVIAHGREGAAAPR